MISNSGHDENGRYHDGAAGDQTGTEWQIIPWYDRPWNYVLRFQDTKIGSLLAELATEAAKNDKIGYDQYQRTTFYTQLSLNGWRPSKITQKCEADCSAGVAALVIAAGHLLGNIALQSVSKDTYTGNLRYQLQNAGAKVLTDKRYLTSDKYLMPGDVLLYEKHHTAINLDYGSAVQSTQPEPFYENIGWNKDDKGWWYAWGSYKGQYHVNNAVRIANSEGKEELYFFDTEGYAVVPSETICDSRGAMQYIKGKRIE